MFVSWHIFDCVFGPILLPFILINSYQFSVHHILNQPYITVRKLSMKTVVLFSSQTLLLSNIYCSSETSCRSMQYHVSNKKTQTKKKTTTLVNIIQIIQIYYSICKYPYRQKIYSGTVYFLSVRAFADMDYMYGLWLHVCLTAPNLS